MHYKVGISLLIGEIILHRRMLCYEDIFNVTALSVMCHYQNDLSKEVTLV